MAAKVENLELFQRFGLKPIENQWVIKPSDEKKEIKISNQTSYAPRLACGVKMA